MTEAQIKEQISKHIIGLIANLSGFSVSEYDVDYGSDLLITKINIFTLNGTRRYLNSSTKYDVQLKCTTIKGIEENNDFVKYDLAVKNYNDLIFRRREISKITIPLILILIVLPLNHKKWLEIDLDKIILNAKRYWFYPNKILAFSDNQQSVRIYIPKKNTVNQNFFHLISKKITNEENNK